MRLLKLNSWHLLIGKLSIWIDWNAWNYFDYNRWGQAIYLGPLNIDWSGCDEHIK